MKLLQVMVEYSGTPGQPFSLGGFLASSTGRWLVIALGAATALFLFRRSKLSTVLFLAAMATLLYFGHRRWGW